MNLHNYCLECRGTGCLFYVTYWNNCGMKVSCGGGCRRGDYCVKCTNRCKICKGVGSLDWIDILVK